MSALIVRIYNYMKSHRTLTALSFLIVTVSLAILVVQQTYKEDISDFLPLNNKYNKALKVYQDISGANKIIAIFQYRDSTDSNPDSIGCAIDKFVSILQTNDKEKVISGLTSQIDMERVAEVSQFVYHNIPYFLTPDHYVRFDSLLSSKDYIPTQIARDKQMLMFPVGLLSENLQRDPLNLFTPVVAELQHIQTNVTYENYDGYIFSADMKRAVVMMNSPYGASETENNARLLKLLQQSADETESDMPEISIRFIGGPVIAVGNSSQIKTDSLISVLLAVVLIVALLFVVFHNFRSLLLIILSIAWGWLFAMGALALIHDRVSVIVIGISSVILGIAVNYPLHLIAHLNHTPDMRSALKEIVMPLVVGNVTTVGAFLALVPLRSAALRDLGLFSSLLLIGTILFVLLYLPHLIKPNAIHSEENFFSKMSNVSLENKRWIVYTTIILTIVLGYFSLDTTFDSNISHINFMTEEQKADMAYFQQMTAATPSEQTVYVVSSDSLQDGAFDKSAAIQPLLQDLKAGGLVADIQSCSQFLCSKEEQARRLEQWNDFVARHGEAIEAGIRHSAAAEGFAEGTFDEFLNLLHTAFEPREADFFLPLSSTVFASSLAADTLRKVYNVVDVVKVAPRHLEQVVSRIDASPSGQYAFDVGSMNASIATRLSDDFNYIGWACGLIVFLFLWFSLGSIELALLSFLPMALSWIWILGIMALLGIQFNVVNVILATFIFGQGDDYTIFMTEGCQYEFAYRRKMLASYKNSIIISALIMFIGIGTLIIARHPALHALAEVTIIGMFSVVLMAYLFPPLIFKWLVSDRGGFRRRPLTLARILGLRRGDDPASLVSDIYRYKGVEISSAVNKSLADYRRNPSAWEDAMKLEEGKPTVIRNSGWGETALLLALTHPQTTIIAIEPDEERRTVAAHSAELVAPNLTYQSEI